MTQHTPGPWRVEERQHVFVHALEDHHIGPLAQMRGNLAYPATDPGVDAAKHSNARLIAAAPELLKALKAVNADLALRAAYRNEAVHQQVRAAIATAEGTS